MKKIFGLICGILMLVGMAAFFILPGWYIPGAVFAVVVVILTIITSLKKKYETKCSKCKTAYDYDTDVEWRLIKRWTEGQPDTSDKLVRSYFLYDITCTCSECGTKKRYRKKIEGPSINDKFEFEIIEPEAVLEDNFDQSTEVGWGAGFFCLIMAVAFFVGGLFFSGKLGAMLADADIYIPGVTQVEKGEDPADYYGAYYARDGHVIKIFDITESECVVTYDNGVEKEVAAYPYEYVSAEWASEHIEVGIYSGKDVILIYQDEDKTTFIPLWVMEKSDGEYKLCDNSGSEYTTDVISWDEYKADPADYYGIYYGSRQNMYLVTLEITESEVKITSDNGRSNSVEGGIYDYVTEEYIKEFYPSYYVEGWDALLVYTDETKEKFNIFCIAYQNGEYSIMLDDGDIVTPTVLTLADIMEDPKDYYGTYKLNSFYVVLNKDGTAKINLGKEEEILPYLYVNQDYIYNFYKKNYNAAIVAYRDDGNAYVFEYESGKLTLGDQYVFEK
ncbi:MAG: hypothetical protein IJW79_10145 [Clostridia bacterium]|nr:hypothetical protein [Clostridia bacterium]